MTQITKGQLTRVQILYGQFSARSLDAGTAREARIAWASEQLGRAITSFSDLSKADATKLIDTLQGALGIAPTKPSRRARRDNKAAGTEGRKDGAANTRTIVSAEDLERIQDALTRLGWSAAQYEAWLRSARSPLAQKYGGTRVAPTDITLRTLRDANRVWWALKGMLKGRGLWKAHS